jgi:WD40 repeat protein
MNIKSLIVSIFLFIILVSCQTNNDTTQILGTTTTDIPETITPETPQSNPLPELQKITVENAKDIQLIRTFQIPNYSTSYTRGQCSTCFSPDGKFVVGVCIKNRIPLWDLETGVLVREHADSQKNEVTCTFDRTGETLVTGGFGPSISFWDLTSGERIESLGEYDDPVWDLDFSPDGRMLASVTLEWDGLLSNPPDDENIRDIQMWDLESGEQLWSVKQGVNFSLSVDFHPNGEVIAVGKTRGDIYIHDAATGEELYALNTVPGWPNPGAGNIGDLAYSPSGKFLAAGSDDDKIWMWETENYEVLYTLEGHESYVNGVVFSADETFLVSSSDDATIGIWDLETREMIKRLEGHAETALRVDMNSDNTLIASISWDGTVKLWGIPVSE